ncbi:DMP19 family protein, partial [Pseudomonas aeruginosa]|nr:DMP19 family protein [Pseudomonas aeruginosa]
MTDRLPCRACGHLILATTAARNDGLCMPCKGGYRQNIEDGKRFHTERRRYLASPQALYWSALVNRVYDGREGFAGLSPAERSYYAVSVLSGEVHNGGFDQYFGNSSGDQYQAARAGLRELEAEDAL